MTTAAALPLTATLRNGLVVTIRALRPDDRERMAAAVRGLDAQSIYTRLFSWRKDLTEAGLERIMRNEPGEEEVLVATTGTGADEKLIGGARYVTSGTTAGRSAEVAFVVEEDYHGLGIAGRLFTCLTQLARSRGIATFEAEVLPENKAMLTVFSRSGLPLQRRIEDGCVHLTLDLRAG